MDRLLGRVGLLVLRLLIRLLVGLLGVGLLVRLLGVRGSALGLLSLDLAKLGLLVGSNTGTLRVAEAGTDVKDEVDDGEDPGRRQLVHRLRRATERKPTK